MIATDILKSEHRVIERVIAVLETASERLQSGEEVRPGLFLDAAQFIKGFADGCHHVKEENVLFKTIESYSARAGGGPVRVMLTEHELGRRFTQGIRIGAERLAQGDASAEQEVIENALGYAKLLRAHIMKEDQVLFPMADKLLPLEAQEQVLAGFDTVEHEETGEGVHEKYLALADALEAEVFGELSRAVN